MVVAGSIWSPSFTRLAASITFSSTLSCTFSCRNSREPAVQTWPWLLKIDMAAICAAWSIGASSNTTTALLPPSSRPTGLRVAAASAAMRLPVSVLPVNITLATM